MHNYLTVVEHRVKARTADLAAGPDRLADVLAICASVGLDPLPEDPTTFVERTLVVPAVDPESAVRRCPTIWSGSAPRSRKPSRFGEAGRMLSA